MQQFCSLVCALSTSLFLLIISGCSGPTLKIPKNLPHIVREYKNIVLHVDPKQIQNSGVYLKHGEFFSVITKDILVRSSLIGLIGRDDFGFLVTDINSAYRSGDLYLSYMNQSESRAGLDIFVWKKEDYLQIADFLNSIKADNPDNSSIHRLLEQINKRKEIFLAELKASKEIEDTKRKINILKKSHTAQNAISETAVATKQSTAATDTISGGLIKDEGIERLETKLAKLNENLKELKELKERLKKEKTRVNYLSEKLFKVTEEKEALKARLESEVDVKKQLEGSLNESELALKKAKTSLNPCMKKSDSLKARI